MQRAEHPLLHAFEHHERALGSAVQSKLDADPADCLANLANIANDFELLVRRKDCLASLAHSEMHLRRERLTKPHTSTYEWIFAKEASSPARTDEAKRDVHFAEWLDRGEGIYWITGKPGSGKSTLMKYIANNPQTEALLRTWSGSSQLYIASHFFWLQGTSLQKSYEGLLRTIIYDVLCRHPTLIKATCDTYWPWTDLNRRDNGSPPAWTSTELKRCLLTLMGAASRTSAGTAYFCFFLDGLDEYDGDKEDVIGLLRDLTRAKNIKICASSRPWEIFRQSFKSSVLADKALVLHHYTKNDIDLVVSETVQPHLEIWKGNAGYLAQVNEVIEEIVQKAQGVFLWVVLVLQQEVIPGLRFADGVDMLRDRLERVPPGR